MSTTPQPFNAFRTLMRRVSLDDRRRYIELINEVVEGYGFDPAQHKYFTQNVSHWPEALNRDEALLYQVDFQYGEDPDAKTYVASAVELALLLKYTPNSFKVAMTTGKGKINRTIRGTKLGKCMVIKLLEPVDLEKYPTVLRLGDREEFLLKNWGAERFKRQKTNQARTLTYKRRSD